MKMPKINRRYLAGLAGLAVLVAVGIVITSDDSGSESAPSDRSVTAREFGADYKVTTVIATVKGPVTCGGDNLRLTPKQLDQLGAIVEGSKGAHHSEGVELPPDSVPRCPSGATAKHAAAPISLYGIAGATG